VSSPGRRVVIRCRCGAVEGEVTGASRSQSNRVVCYCDDCQAYARHLGRADILDAHGGSDVIQVAPAALSFSSGADRIACVRLSESGLFRWNASCCKTPVGNTMRPWLPFVGIVRSSFAADEAEIGEVFGEPFPIMEKHAVGTLPDRGRTTNRAYVLRVIPIIAGWKLRGRAWPHPFFDRETGQSKFPITIVTRAERDALRADYDRRRTSAR
jgi:hypothetical protein